MANKTCTKCQETKTLDQFYKNSTPHYKFDGYDYYCKYCRKGSHLKSVRENKKKCSLEDCNKPHYAKTYCRVHYARLVTRNHVDRTLDVVDTEKTYNINGKLQVYKRNSMLKRQYHITLDEYKERSANGCELCGEVSEISYHVDHDHKCCNSHKSCGKCVRGIICHKCNVAVDKMEKGVMRPDYPNYWLIEQYLEAYSG
jgi:hypothetical protein